MKASRNTERLHRPVDVSSAWEDVKEWARRKITNEKVAEVSLSLAAAVSLCYLGSRIHVGLQNYVLYAY
jgi:uncharacterized protein (DUF2267 family)